MRNATSLVYWLPTYMNMWDTQTECWMLNGVLFIRKIMAGVR